MQCRTCGYMAPDTARFCTNCGKPLAAPPTPGAPVVTPPQVPPPGAPVPGPPSGAPGQVPPPAGPVLVPPPPAAVQTPPAPHQPHGPPPSPQGTWPAQGPAPYPQPQTVPPAWGKAPQPTSQTPSEGQTPISTYMMGAMIMTALTGVLLIVDDFAGGYWNNYYSGVEDWVWVGAWSSWWGFLIIMPMTLAMLYVAFWSSRAMRDPGIITVAQLRRNFIICAAIGTIVLILGVAWAAYSISEEYDDWWLDIAFYAGVIGGFISAAIFHMARGQAVSQGYPDGQTAGPPPGQATWQAGDQPRY